MSFTRGLTRRGSAAGPPRTRTASGRLRVRPTPSRVRRLLTVTVGLAVVLLGGWLWLRDSSLVAVERVTVTGADGPEAGAIRSALIVAAHSMTTLDINTGQLHNAVSPFPEVKSLRVSTQFPHGLRIRVIEQLPVAAVVVAGRRLAVASDGTLLHVPASSRLPLIPLSVPPGGPKLTEPWAQQAIALVTAAPYQILPKLSQVTTTAGHGLVAQLRDGPSIYFGTASDLHAKWISATEVLADPGSAGASYIDVTDPMRPAAGVPGATTANDGAAGTASAVATTTGAPAGTTGAMGSG